MSEGMIEVATCSFGEYRPEMGYPIRTSRGAPKWFTFPYMNWENVFPSYPLLTMELERYEPRYLAMLDRIGPDVLLGDLYYMAEEYAKANGGVVKPLVLLCYEKLSKGPDNWCHRTMLAGYLQRNFHMPVPELGACLADHVPPPDPEPTLF